MTKDTPVYQVKLERVIGLTVSSNAALDCDPNSEQIAYPAGCTVVVYNPRKNKQTHIVNSCRKTITSVAYSPDGRYLVTGESGHLPSVRLWELPSESSAPTVQVAELPGHKYGINCVAFSPMHKYVVSVGSQHDMIVNVWDWRSHVKVASNKVSAKVKAVSFAENGSYFVTVGIRHVKFWYLERSRSSKYKEPVPLMGRSAILGEQRNNYFCDVACGRGDMADSTYAITKSGLLCEFNNRRLLDKWVELRTTSANCLALGADFIFIGCAEGIVRCFSPHTLAFVTTLPRTHYLGVDVALGLNITHMTQHPNNAKYPDAIALAYDPVNAKLTCVYNDHSLYIWDVRDIKRVGKAHSFLFHSACIWGVDVYPGGPALPPATLVTCSSDDTIRFWHLDSAQLPNGPSPYRNNIYSDDLLKVVYVDDQLTYLKDLDLSGANGGSGGQSERSSDGSYDGHNGVRAIRFSPDGKHLASGDRLGNIRIHDLMTLTELCLIQAHDAEVLCLEYNRPDSDNNFLASASRDRLIHLFNVDKGYEIVQTLDDHSSSITAVRFLQTNDQLQLVSCGADKSIIFRQRQQGTAGQPAQFSRGHNVAGKTTLYDMEVDSGQKHVLTACQDRNIRVYSVSSGKHTKTFKGSVGEDGSLIKVVLDPSGIYAATSCTDKTLCVYDYYSCELMATMLGHSELVTGLRFTEDCQRLISASGDGCLFVWRLPHDMVVTMHARLSQQSARASRKAPVSTNGIPLDNESFGPPSPSMMDPNANSIANDYRFTISPLPLWAKKQISTSTETNTQGGGGGGGGRGGPDLPRGRWAQRVGQAGWGITVKSVYNNDSLITYPVNQDGSKDSSIDSGTDTKQPEPRRERISSRQDEEDDFTPCDESFQEIMFSPRSLQIDTPHKSITTRVGEMSDANRARQLTDDSSLGSFKYEDLEGTEHDGDIEDYSEGEGESTEPEQLNRLIFYPPVEESGSEYKVNAMDVEELRRSQRLKKSQQSNRLLTAPEFSGFSASATSVSGSQESDDDDEDVSTPSGENTDRNILHSASTESIDRIGTREKYLKSTFESLGNSGEQDNNKDLAKTSLSSQHHTTRGLMPPPPPPKPLKLIKSTNEGTLATNPRKRDELNRRIEETRRKLQSVGRTNLKSSQSISDLSHAPTETTANGLHARRYIGVEQLDVESNNLRRACSLSDLSGPNKIVHAKPVQVSGKLGSKNNINTRTIPRHLNKASSGMNNMIRSTSMVILNQSDSESDIIPNQRNSNLSRIKGLMRPTISSQNKINSLAKSHSTTFQLPRRRNITQAYPSVNTLAANTEDSSSEEAVTPAANCKPAVRPRSASVDRGQTIPEPRPRMRTSALEASPQELPVKDTDTPVVDVASAPLSQQLCASVADQLTRTADNVVQLYKRLALEGQRTDSSEMLRDLAEAINEAQSTLNLVVSGNSLQGTGNSFLSNDTSGGGLDNNMTAVVQTYSDLLINIFQQRISKTTNTNTTSTSTSNHNSPEKN